MAGYNLRELSRERQLGLDALTQHKDLALRQDGCLKTSLAKLSWGR